MAANTSGVKEDNVIDKLPTCSDVSIKLDDISGFKSDNYVNNLSTNIFFNSSNLGKSPDVTVDNCIKVLFDLDVTNPEATMFTIYCNICNMQLDINCDLEEHDKLYHIPVKKKKKKPLSLDYVFKVIQNNKQLSENNHSPATNYFVCEECALPFTDAKKYAIHSILKHEISPPYLCPVCNNEFKHKNTLRCHVWKHSKVRPYGCKYCKKSYVLPSDLKKHLYVKHIGGLI